MPITIVHQTDLSDQERDAIHQAIPGEFESCGDHQRLHHKLPVAGGTLAQLRDALAFDINPLPPGFESGEVRLLITDMDSTLINIECVDEIADFAGRRAEVATVTEAAMRGEIDFATSLTRRVAALKGLDEGVLHQVYQERLSLNPGAETLLAGLKGLGVRIALVSGGFTFFTERLKARLGLDHARANVLEIQGACLTGKVLGGIIDARGKAAFLKELCAAMAIEPAQVIAMGDGANDLEMMQLAGCGVAYRAKPKVQAATDVVINRGGLDSVLHLLRCC